MMEMLKVSGNSESQRIRLFGNRADPEPAEVRIEFPGGYVAVSRCNANGGAPDYWVHVGVFHPGHPDEQRTCNMVSGKSGPTALITDARVDCFDRSDTVGLAVGLTEPNVDHVAIRVARKER